MGLRCREGRLRSTSTTSTRISTVPSLRARCGEETCLASGIAINFAQDAEDETWIPAVAQKGWIIVTRDLAIRRRPAERAAWLAANAVVIMVRGEKLSGADLESILSAAYAGGRLDNFIAKRTRPMIVYLTRSGQLSVQEGGARRGGQKKG